MKNEIASNAKNILSKIIPNSPLFRFLTYLPKLEKWRKERAKDAPLFKVRNELYSYLNKEIIKNARVDYLEFGVFEGESIKYWSEINTDTGSKFWGFDTFEGLPHDWDLLMGKMEKGTFDTKGQFPKIDDERVNFVKGLFQDALPPFLEKEKITPQLIIHCDADLYSSTLYVLTKCSDLIVPGTIVIFDEFSTVIDEYRALEDFCQAYVKDYEVLGGTKSVKDYYTQVAIKFK